MQKHRGLRIDPLNKLILGFAEDHPARQVLVARAICQRDCAGREVPYRDAEHLAIDQEWQSSVDGKRWTFSGFIYSYVCFDLVLTGWIERPPYLAEDERGVLENIPKVCVLLDECENAARESENHEVLEMIPRARRFFELWEQSIHLRIQQDDLKTENS